MPLVMVMSEGALKFVRTVLYWIVRVKVVMSKGRETVVRAVLEEKDMAALEVVRAGSETSGRSELPANDSKFCSVVRLGSLHT